jgi:hypothetical protein
MCRSSPFKMPDNVGLNRQRNRQQKRLPVVCTTVVGCRYFSVLSGVMMLMGIEIKPLLARGWLIWIFGDSFGDATRAVSLSLW